jgi:hypothetical protein
MYYVTLQWPSISEISCVRLHVVSTSSQRVQPVMKWDQYVGGARLSSGLQGADEKSDRSPECITHKGHMSQTCRPNLARLLLSCLSSQVHHVGKSSDHRGTIEESAVRDAPNDWRLGKQSDNESGKSCRHSTPITCPLGFPLQLQIATSSYPV